MKVIISSGVGRLHFIETAKALLPVFPDFELVCGYVPKKSHRWWINRAGWLLGRNDLAKRLEVRLGGGAHILKSRLRSNGWAEAVAQLALRLGNLGFLPKTRGQRWSWKYFGWRTRPYLRDQNIFHVRSGAGQGGAITQARRRGMKILVDHSIAHPSYMQRVLEGEYAAVGMPCDAKADDPFWSLVLEDCVQADTILVNSEFVKKTLVDAGLAAANIVVNYLGVRPDFWGLKQGYVSNGRLKLLFTGSFDLRKGCRVLLEAMEELKERGMDFELHVAGDARQGRRYFDSRLACLPVIWHGSLLQDDLKELLASCDLYVFPTLAEGCARSAMEAMFAGLPVITTEACGLPGVPGDHYCAVPVGNAISLADEIARLGLNVVAREKLGRAGVMLAKSGHYTWESYGHNLAGIYGDLLEQRSRKL